MTSLAAKRSEGLSIRVVTNPGVLNCIHGNKLFRIPDALMPYAQASEIVEEAAASTESQIESNDENSRVNEFLSAPFKQVEKYQTYIEGNDSFDTHQGVKGLQFPRVLVVIDNEEAGGNFFSYEKLFGVKERTRSDVDNQRAGKETSIDKTKRLFYVTCSRSQKSLAIVAHTSNHDVLRETVISNRWFKSQEIEQLSCM